MFISGIRDGTASAAPIQILTNSVRYRSASFAYLDKTFSSGPTSTTSASLSFWIKRGNSNVTQTLFGLGLNLNNRTTIDLLSNGTLAFSGVLGGTSSWSVNTDQTLRDPTAWYHLVFVVDSSATTNTERVRIYINGTRATFQSASYPTAGLNILIGTSGTPHCVGRSPLSPTGPHFDGYMSEFVLTHGTGGFDASAFGTVDPNSGMWTPIDFAGPYGVNGTRLQFDDGTSLTTLGLDTSGNGNNWTLVNFSLAPGVFYDWIGDTPTNNHGIWNPMSTAFSDNVVSLGSLRATTTVNTLKGPVLGTFGMMTGKWYWEITPGGSTGPAEVEIGIVSTVDTDNYLSQQPTGYCYIGTGNKANNGVSVAYGESYSYGDVIGVAFDADAGTLTFYKNGVSQGVAFTGIQGTFLAAACDNTTLVGDLTFDATFGQRPYVYTPPGGFKTLSALNLPDTPILNGKEHMTTFAYAGNFTDGRLITTGNFDSDIAWFKTRSLSNPHAVHDRLRGNDKAIFMPDTTGERAFTGYMAFEAPGTRQLRISYSGSAGARDDWNNGSHTYASWHWKAGGAGGVANTNGSISSTVSANVDAGISIVRFTGTGANGTVGHGLNSPPAMIWSTPLVSGPSNHWRVGHIGLSGGFNAYVTFNDSAAQTTLATQWNNTAPTSSVFSVGSQFTAVQQVAYCFAEVPGFSRIGKFVGTGSSVGTYIHCGFKPQWVLIRRVDSSGGPWKILDTVRSPNNIVVRELSPNNGSQEASGAGIDVTATGFRMNGSSDNAAGGTYIFAAFAFTPYKYSTAF